MKLRTTDSFELQCACAAAAVFLLHQFVYFAALLCNAALLMDIDGARDPGERQLRGVEGVIRFLEAPVGAVLMASGSRPPPLVGIFNAVFWSCATWIAMHWLGRRRPEHHAFGRALHRRNDRSPPPE